MDWLNLLIGGFCGGLILFFWNGMAWMGLPHHHGDFDSLPNRSDFESAIDAVPRRSVFYSVPHFKEFEGGMKNQDYVNRMKKGPNAIVVITDPQDSSMGPAFTRALVLDFFEALGLALALAFFLPALGDRLTVRLVLFLGLAVFASFPVLANLSNWMGFPWRFAFTSTFDKCVGYLLVALAFYLLGTGAPQ